MDSGSLSPQVYFMYFFLKMKKKNENRENALWYHRSLFPIRPLPKKESWACNQIRKSKKDNKGRKIRTDIETEKTKEKFEMKTKFRN